MDIVYFDFEKAFDRMIHQAFANKIRFMGFKSRTVEWFTSYLSNRKFRVKVNQSLSRWSKAEEGVPQGGVLSPIIFNMFIADISQQISTKLAQFADDTKLHNLANNSENCKKLQADVNNLVSWTHRWGMKLNHSKCSVMHCGPRNKNYNYTIDGKSIKKTKEEKDLGLTVDSSFTWSLHSIQAAKKANRMLGLIRRAFGFIPIDRFKIVYNTYIRPLLEYNQAVCAPLYIKDSDCLERVQRRTTKLVPGLWNMNYEDRLEALNMTTLKDRRKRGDLIEYYKILVKDHYCIDTSEWWTKCGPTALRKHSRALYKKRVIHNFNAHNFRNRAVNEWNKLPEEVISATTINTFKNRLDSWIKATRSPTYVE